MNDKLFETPASIGKEPYISEPPLGRIGKDIEGVKSVPSVLCVPSGDHFWFLQHTHMSVLQHPLVLFG